MNTPEKEKIWKKRELALELDQLRREKQHLSSVGVERPLTGWEKMRALQLITEFRRVNTLLNDLRYV